MALVTFAVRDGARMRELHASVDDVRAFAAARRDHAMLVVTVDALQKGGVAEALSHVLDCLLPGDVAVTADVLEQLAPNERTGAVALFRHGAPVELGPSSAVSVLVAPLVASLAAPPASPPADDATAAASSAPVAPEPSQPPPPEPRLTPFVREIALKVASNVLNDVSNPLPARITILLASGKANSLAAVLMLSDAELLALPDIGEGSLRALQIWVARESERLGMPLSLEDVRAVLRSAAIDASAEADAEFVREAVTPLEKTLRSMREAVRALPVDLLYHLSKQTHTWMEKNCVATVGDLAPWSEQRLAEERNIGTESIKPLRDAIKSLVVRVEKVDPRGTLSPEELLRALIRLTPLEERRRQALAQLPGQMSALLEQRLFTMARPPSLQELADTIGCGPESILRVEAFAKKALDHGGHLTAFLDARLRELRADRRTPLSLDDLAELEPWFAGTTHRPELLRGLLRLLGAQHAVGILRDAGTAFVTLASAADTSALVTDCETFLVEAQRTTQVLPAVTRWLESRGVPELLPLVCARLPLRVAARLELELELAGEPLTLASLHERVERAGVQIGPRQLRNQIERLALKSGRAVLVGPSMWAPATTIAPWEPRAAELTTHIAALIADHPQGRWTAEELAIALDAHGTDWAREMPAWVLNALVRPIHDLVYLRGFVWATRDAGMTPEHVVGVAAEILEEQGTPLPYAELVRRVRDRRNAGPAIQVRWPLVRMDDQIGLADRELGIHEHAWQALRQRVTAELAEADSVSSARIAEIWAALASDGEVAAPHVNTGYLTSLLTAEPDIVRDRIGTGVRARTASRDVALR